MKTHFMGNEKVYKLTLSDGRTWGFSAADKIHSWLKSFVDIMQLKEGSGSETDFKFMFIAQKGTNKLPVLDNKKEWEPYRSGRSFRVWHHSTVPEIFIELDPEFMDHESIRVINMWNSFKPLYEYYTKHGGGPVHAAFAGFEGKGILITAPGNTGKTTCISRLPAYWEALSDDTALVVNNAVGQYRVHPLPTWSDYLCNRKRTTFNLEYSLPLEAVYFLEQAESDEVIKLTKGQAAQEFFESFKQSWNTYWHRMDDDKKKTKQMQVLDNSIKLSKSIPCYRLKATLHGEFWENIEKML